MFLRSRLEHDLNAPTNLSPDEKPDEKWIVFDGPVDTLWIESMNSVMDDNKILTLINGERISMPEQVSLLFEVEDLAVASPATVSRCGMVFNDYADMGCQPYINSWLQTFSDKVRSYLLWMVSDCDTLCCLLIGEWLQPIK